MSSATVLSLVEQLEDNIEDLEEDLQPVISAALSTTTKKLPLLDKAKLYVVVVYAIESLLFSYLRLNGVTAKEHPVFRELTRVKQYFEKIKEAEQGPPKPRENLSLNKQAAGRFIKHALSGNEKYDLERAEREAREKFLAKRKLVDLEKTMKDKAEATSLSTSSQQPTTKEEDAIMREAAQLAAKLADDDDNLDDDREEGEVDDDSVDDMVEATKSNDTTVVTSTPTPRPSQFNHSNSKRKRGNKDDPVDASAQSLGQDEAQLSKKARKKSKKKSKKEKK